MVQIRYILGKKVEVNETFQKIWPYIGELVTFLRENAKNCYFMDFKPFFSTFRAKTRVIT